MYLGSLPTDTQEVLLFHAHAYRLAVTCYRPMLPFGITLKEPDLMQSCRMTVDEQPYYNPSSVPFCIEQPLAMPDEETFRQRKQNSESAPELYSKYGCNLIVRHLVSCADQIRYKRFHQLYLTDILHRLE